MGHGLVAEERLLRAGGDGFYATVDGEALVLAGRARDLAGGGDELEVAGGAAELRRGDALRGLGEPWRRHSVGTCRERRPPLAQRRIDPGPQLAANDEVRDRRCDRDGQGERDRRSEAEARAQAHSGTLCSVGLRLPSQVADENLQRVRCKAQVVAPHALEEGRPGQHLPRMEHEQLEESELSARQVDRAAGTSHLARDRVELEIREVQGAVVAGGSPAQQRAQAGEELAERERLDEIVVGARVETVDSVLDRVARRQHQDGNTAAQPDRPAGLPAVERRHQNVQHDRIGRRALVVEETERLDSVRGELDLVALQAERTPQRLAQ